MAKGGNVRWRVGYVKRRKCSLAAAAAVSAVIASAMPTLGAEIYTGDSEVKLRWDNTFKYTNSYRVSGQLPALISNINTDDGDRNFKPGLISNRLDLLSELDLSYHNFGARVSGAAWYDTVYNQSNDNESPATFNPISVGHTDFPHATRRLLGRDIDLLDAFVYADGSVGSLPANIRAGRHTLLWGESLLISNNGIASAQAPIDFIKQQSVPNTLAKELFLPVTQISGSIQVTPELSFAAYAQAEWRRDRIAPVEGYFSFNDLLDVGGERLFAGSPSRFFLRANDEAPSDFGFGQGGISAKYRVEPLDTDFGLYALNYDDKVPQVATVVQRGGIPGQIGQYLLVFPKNAHLVGASFSTDIGEANLAGEVSERWNEPLVSTAQTVRLGTVDADRPPGAIGNSFHAQVSALYNLPPTIWWEGGTFTGEIAWAHLTGITHNAQALDPTTHHDAVGIREIFSPTYFQVLPGLDISLPLGLGYNPRGRSSAVQSFNGDGGADNGGDVTFGVSAIYLNAWLASLTYTRYFEFNNLVKNPIVDRDFIALSIRRTF